MPGPSALGELGYELSFPFFAVAIASAAALTLLGRPFAVRSALALRIGLAFLAVIALSYISNAADIGGALFRERSGINKFATSLMVILYGLSLAWLAEQLEPKHYARVLGRFVGWSASLATAYLAFEFAGRQGWLGGAFETLDHLIHSRQADVINPWDGSVNQKVAFGWDQRLRSVSFEPPAFGNYTGFAWPWIWYAVVTAPAGRQLRTVALFLAFNIAILVAANRTALLMLVANTSTLALLWTIYRPRRSVGEAVAAARLALPVVVMLSGVFAAWWTLTNYGSIVESVAIGDSVSNISRLGLQVAGWTMFVDHPIFGTGLGQFGFHVSQYLPNWIFRSPEIAPMLRFPDAPWPNVFSLYARLGAELGAIGLVGWVVLWVGLGGAMALRTAIPDEKKVELFARQAAIMNCVGVLVAGIASDTFRTPMMWIALGVAARLVAENRKVIAKKRVQPPAAEQAPRH